MASAVPDGYVEYDPSWERAPIFTSFMTVLEVRVISLSIAILIYFSSTNFTLVLLTWPVVVGTIVLHETVHALLSWLLGCEISVGVETREWWNASPYDHLAQCLRREISASGWSYPYPFAKRGLKVIMCSARPSRNGRKTGYELVLRTAQ